MKKFLMATSAIVGVTMLAGQAVAADAPSVSVSGFTSMNWTAQSKDDNTNKHGLYNDDSEVVVKASGKADNGLEYGAKIEMSTIKTDTNTTDENVMWVKGSWGTIEIGNEDGAHDRLAVAAPAGFGTGGLDGDNDAGKSSIWDASDTGDATKITYFGAAGAVSFGVSFVPASDATGDTIDTTTGGYNSVIEAGVKYSGEASGAKFTVGIAGSSGDTDANDATQDLSTWQAGVSVSTGGFTVGAMYADNGDSGAAAGVDKDGWNIGVQYGTGPWTVGAQYGSTDNNGTDEDSMAVGFTYSVAPGLSVGGEYVTFDDGGTDKGDALTLTTGVSF